MTQDEAVGIARSLAQEKGWEWREPVYAARCRSGFAWGPWVWEVYSNRRHRGRNVRVIIDEQSGKVLRSGFYAH